VTKTRTPVKKGNKNAYQDDATAKIKPVIKAVRKEVERAMTLHSGSMRNAHEAYAVLLEEVDELWDEVKKNSKTRDPIKMREEAIQVAAMAVRMIVDVL
jgi:NTP pyrophosphatase (non-canonical NTP hydrolase)